MCFNSMTGEAANLEMTLWLQIPFKVAPGPRQLDHLPLGAPHQVLLLQECLLRLHAFLLPNLLRVFRSSPFGRHHRRFL